MKKKNVSVTNELVYEFNCSEIKSIALIYTDLSFSIPINEQNLISGAIGLLNTLDYF
mgnify:CR=1